MSPTNPHTEAAEQIRLARALDQAALLWTATANGGARSKRSGATLKASGVKAGVPDLLIFTPAAGAPQGAAVELKRLRPRKGRLSAEQKIWLERLNAAGVQARACYGAADAVDFLNSLGYSLSLTPTTDTATPQEPAHDDLPASRHSRAPMPRKRRRHS